MKNEGEEVNHCEVEDASGFERVSVDILIVYELNDFVVRFEVEGLVDSVEE